MATSRRPSLGARIAHGLGLAVIAEGVARRKQLELLRDHDCDEFQGFLKSPPLAPDGAAQLIAAQAG